MRNAGLRHLIREMLLVEAAYTPERASEEGFTFKVYRTKWGHGGWDIVCSRVENYRDIVGSVNISRPMGYGNCLGAYEVNLSRAEIDGLGPLLYDIAMELAGPTGLMPDRNFVSPRARKVWHYYHDNRPDIEHDQLDSRPGILTPEVEDDCSQTSARDDRRDWKKSPLSKVYRKRGTPTIDKLRALGIIEIA